MQNFYIIWEYVTYLTLHYRLVKYSRHQSMLIIIYCHCVSYKQHIVNSTNFQIRYRCRLVKSIHYNKQITHYQELSEEKPCLKFDNFVKYPRKGIHKDLTDSQPIHKGTSGMSEQSSLTAANWKLRHLPVLLLPYTTRNMYDLATYFLQDLSPWWPVKVSTLFCSLLARITASLLSTQLGDGKQYDSSRDFAASTGLVPRQYSTGGRTTLMGISKRGNKKLRALLVQCSRVYLRTLEHRSGKLADWVRALLRRKNNFVVTSALATKLASIAWALTVRQQIFEA